MDLIQAFALAILAAILATNAGTYFRLGRLCQGFEDIGRRVDKLEGSTNELASKAA